MRARAQMDAGHGADGMTRFRVWALIMFAISVYAVAGGYQILRDLRRGPTFSLGGLGRLGWGAPDKK